MPVQNGTFSLATLANEDVTGLSDFEVELKALELLPTIPAARATNGNNFYTIQHSPESAEPWPPLPANLAQLPAWQLGGGFYLLDDRDYVWGQRKKSKRVTTLQSGGGVHAMDAPSVPGDGGGDDDDGDYSGSYITPFSTNGLWLQITTVSNGLAYLNLMNATDSVYEILSTVTLTNGVNSWNIESEVWPTNTVAMPFTVPELGRTNLFIWAMDWTRIDANSNGIADWWEWKYFGNFSQPTNESYDGINTILYDYTNDLDPNVIQFSLQFTNNYVHANPAYGAVSILGGVPSYEAILVNDSNLADAIWQPYTSSSFMASLNSGDGTYNVLVGLKGLPSDATTTWAGTQLILDTAVPVLIITNPVPGGTVSVPMIQLQGLVNESLSSLTFDVSNALGVVTNQTGYWQPVFCDTNLLQFTTNIFQCCDVRLTNGMNQIVVHAFDLAGNETTTNVNVTVDYSGDTTPPALNVIWPHNGTYISGSSFTFQGSVDDATATVTAQIVDASGDTNAVQGLVERDGKITIGNLPVSAGANVLTVTATDAAGNSTTTNLTVTQSGVTVTIDPLSSDQANQPHVSVTGTISDTSGNVCIQVNGTNAYYLDAFGDWEADYVPVNPTGTAIFDVELYTNDPVNIGSQVFTQVQPPLLTLANYTADIGYYDEQSGRLKVQWNYLNGGSYAMDMIDHGFDLHYFGGTNLPPDGTNYTTPTITYGYNIFSTVDGSLLDEDLWSAQFSPLWRNANAQAKWLDKTLYFQKSIQTTPMIVPVGPKLPGVTKTYRVRVCAKLGPDISFDFLVLNGSLDDPNYGDTPVPPGQLQINGHTLVSSGITNSDGSFWGTSSVSAPAGTLVPLYVTGTGGNYDFTFNAEIVKDKLYWQNLVQGEIDADSSVVIENYLASNGFMANRQNIQAVFNFYGKLFTEEPDEFYWCGLAKLVGSPVYAGLSDAEYAKAGTLGVGTASGSLITEILTLSYLIPKMNQFQQIMVQMNIHIFDDLAWQFEAYKNGGLDAIKEIAAVDSQDIDLATWQEIDDGVQNDDVSEIQDGNILLARREQQVTVAQDYQNLQNLLPNTGIFSPYATNTVGFIVSYLGQNPVIGGPSFWNFEPSSADLTVFSYRWDWVTGGAGTNSSQGMIPLWLAASDSDRLAWVNEPIKARAKQFSYAYYWLYLPPF